MFVCFVCETSALKSTKVKHNYMHILLACITITYTGMYHNNLYIGMYHNNLYIGMYHNNLYT